MLLQYIYKSIYKFVLNDIEFNQYAKPYCKDGEISFNISHTHDILAIATGFYDVGLDIEYIKQRDVRLISSKYFTINEQKLLQCNNYSLNVFYKIWILKEIYLKYLGTGLSIRLDSLDVYNYFNCKNKSYENDSSIVINSFDFNREYVAAILKIN